MTDYDPKITPWTIDENHYPSSGSRREKMEFLIRYAVLAPSSHNTEPWQFRLHHDAIDVMIDRSRWLKVADADQRELHISVGCALENLLIAAEHFGLGHSALLMPDADDPLLAARVKISDNGSAEKHCPPKLFETIPVRHTNHGVYDGVPIPEDILKGLMACCVEPEIVVHLTDDSVIKASVDEWVVKGDAIQFVRSEYREELAHWIGQGVFGNSWLMSKIGQFAVSHFNVGKSTAKKDHELMMSSPVFGLIASETEGRPQQIMVGQVFQRISLLAATHGIWCQPMSQLVEVPEIKQELMMAAPKGGLVPQHPFRMGFAQPEKDHTPRRQLSDVIVT